MLSFLIRRAADQRREHGETPLVGILNALNVRAAHAPLTHPGALIIANTIERLAAASESISRFTIKPRHPSSRLDNDDVAQTVASATWSGPTRAQSKLVADAWVPARQTLAQRTTALKTRAAKCILVPPNPAHILVVRSSMVNRFAIYLGPLP